MGVKRAAAVLGPAIVSLVLAAALFASAGCVADATRVSADAGATPATTTATPAVPAAVPTQPAAQQPAAQAQPQPEPQPEPRFSAELIPATVVRVVDGDTAVFRLADGRTEKTRFIGIDTPESTTRTEPYGKEASAYTRRALPVGADVWLQKDVEERDRYGRLLAYVWLATPKSDSESEIRGKMLNAKLALDGYAQQMTIQPNSRYADYFREFVAEARNAERGLWGSGGGESAAPAATSAAAKSSNAGGSTAAYVGNRNTMKFHLPDCSSVTQMNPANQVALASRAAAVSQGYVPCKRCNP